MLQNDVVKPKRVTIKDIAEYCGLSKSTVAYIISNSEYRKGSEENRKLVEKAVKALNYRPNHAAKSLSSRRGFTIGVTMPIAGSSFYDEMALHLQKMIKKLGYHSMFSFWGVSDPPAAREEAFKVMFERNVDGVLSWDNSLQFLHENIPTVVYGLDPGNCYDSVEPDFERLASEALEYLVGLGHRKIGFLGFEDDSRYFYLKQLAPTFGVDMNPEWCSFPDRASLSVGNAERFLRQSGKNLPTALFVQSDSIAIPAIKSIYKAGLQVPEDISIISCDNIKMAEFCRPGLTTFDINLEEIATAMVQQLLERMNHSGSALKTIKIRPKLIIRESCRSITK